MVMPSEFNLLYWPKVKLLGAQNSPISTGFCVMLSTIDYYYQSLIKEIFVWGLHIGRMISDMKPEWKYE